MITWKDTFAVIASLVATVVLVFLAFTALQLYTNMYNRDELQDQRLIKIERTQEENLWRLRQLEKEIKAKGEKP
jgi:hypothetical protein